MASIDLKITRRPAQGLAVRPAVCHPGSAGIDLRACIELAIKIQAGETMLVPTGIAFTCPIRGWRR
jgi:dUTP pyrophosphatase